MDLNTLIGAYNRPCQGERVSGDDYVIKLLNEGLFIAIFDVLGHGLEAHNWALKYQAHLHKYGSQNLLNVLKHFQQNFWGSHGAVMALAFIPADLSELHYVGIGNTVLRKWGQPNARLESQFGTIGRQIRTPHVQKLALMNHDLLLFYTDGIKSSFSLPNFPQLFFEEAKEIAQEIVMTFGRSYDDACCIALKVLK